MKRAIVAWLAICAASLCTSAVHAQQVYPHRSIRFIVPQPPGGTSDLLARLLGQKLSEQLGQSVVIDNRPGASGTIGTDAAAKAQPDGHTIVLIYTTHTTSPSLYSKLPYHPVNDFAPVTMALQSPLLLVVNPQVRAKTVTELMALARERPGQLNFGSAGNGSGSHLAGELFNVMANVKMVHVPYKGSGQAITDLIGGQIQLMFAGLLPAQPHVRSGKLRALALTSSKRSTVMPEVPTVAENGLPKFEFVGWYGILAPAGTPRSIVSRLHGEFVKILQLPDVRARLAGDGAEPIGDTPEEFTRYLRADVARWAEVIRKSGARLD